MQDLRNVLTTTTAMDSSLRVPSLEETSRMTEEERRAALDQFAHQLETASASDIMAILCMHQPANPVSASLQNGAPSSSHGDTTSTSHAHTGPNQEPPQPQQ